MNKYILFLLFLFCFSLSKAQIAKKSPDQFPVFPDCVNQFDKELENCFFTQVQDFIYSNFKVPDNLVQTNYKGTVSVLFEVNEKGKFNVQYVDAVDDELVKESKRVFEKFPVVGPPTYNGKPIYSKYTIKISIPNKSAAERAAETD